MVSRVTSYKICHTGTKIYEKLGLNSGTYWDDLADNTFKCDRIILNSITFEAIPKPLRMIGFPDSLNNYLFS